MYIPNIFTDPVIDEKARTQRPKQYIQIFINRSTRYKLAFANHMFGYTNMPRPTLMELQAKAEFYTEILNNDPNNTNIQNKLNDVNKKIADQDYVVEGTPDYTYFLNYTNKLKEFKTIYPDANESSIRQDEEQKLLAELT